ncbi:MAG: DUF2721 domain-containing protein [Planctomycetia bacterium]|nr:DUF2721 domain-containing protein [Planctomycetia bacterium]
MEPLAANPLSLLTFIAAPAILTNASSIMSLGTANRFARAIDRARALSKEVGDQPRTDDPAKAFRVRQLRYAERRALLLVRALTAFYVSVGSFGAASLISLVAGALFVVQQDLPRQIALGIALCAGMVGVGGLVVGSGLLVWETRMTLYILREETAMMLRAHDA